MILPDFQGLCARGSSALFWKPVQNGANHSVVKQKYVLLLSCLQRVAASMIRFTQRTISESFGHGKHRGLLVQDEVPITSSYVLSGICFKCSRPGERAQQFFIWNSWRG